MADDLVQDTLVRAYERANSFAEGRSLRNWLFAIMHNRFISDCRRSESAQRLSDSLMSTAGVDLVAETQENAVYLQQIAEMFAGLPPEQRSVLHLIAVEGLTYQEAADTLDISLGTIMSRLNRARAALRREPPESLSTLRIIGGTDVS